MTDESTAPATIQTTAPPTTELTPPPLDPVYEFNKGQVGMIAFLVTEVAFFSTLIAVYITYIGQSRVGPFPNQVFKMPLVIISTVCLLSSSVTIHFATGALHRGSVSLFRLWWLATIVLGVVFLGGTAYEWRELIHDWHLTPWRNLFGTTYFTLVGFHALHVSIGVLVMLMTLGYAWSRFAPKQWPLDAELVSWYWHFVDVVWVFVFTVVYIVGR